MAHWAVIIERGRWATERLFRHDTVAVPGTGSVPGAGAGPAPSTGDDVLVVAGGEQPAVVALGQVCRNDAANGAPELVVAYLRRAFDDPAPADGLQLDEPVSPVPPDVFRRFRDRLGGAGARRTWLVSLDLPIEAETPAEAVRQFWSYVLELGPGELPTFVAPSGDELAMQAFVLGAEANLDPEEDED
jgi:hypothetical protein